MIINSRPLHSVRVTADAKIVKSSISMTKIVPRIDERSTESLLSVPYGRIPTVKREAKK